MLRALEDLKGEKFALCDSTGTNVILILGIGVSFEIKGPFTRIAIGREGSAKSVTLQLIKF